MSNKVRFAGAPYTSFQKLDENKKAILEALKWAGKNDCDWLLIEGSSSDIFPILI